VFSTKFGNILCLVLILCAGCSDGNDGPTNPLNASPEFNVKILAAEENGDSAIMEWAGWFHVLDDEGGAWTHLGSIECENSTNECLELYIPFEAQGHVGISIARQPNEFDPEYEGGCPVLRAGGATLEADPTREQTVTIVYDSYATGSCD